jgi:PAS domain S-box-containing protein
MPDPSRADQQIIEENALLRQRIKDLEHSDAGRERAETAHREDEQRHRDYITNAPYGVFVADDRGRYVEVNPSACRITGYDEHELLSMGIPDLLFEDEREDSLRHFEALGRDGTAYGELVFRSKSGERRWWSVSAVRLSDTRYLGFCSDITDRKHAESEAQQSEACYRDLFDANPHPMWVFDVQTLRFLAVDDAAVAQYGYSRDEFLSLTIEAIRPAADLAHLHDTLDRASVNPGVDKTRARHRKRDGTVINVEIASHGLEFGGRRARLIVAHDVLDLPASPHGTSGARPAGRV